MFAARYGHLSIVNYLASLGARLENSTTYNPLHAACFGHSTNVVRFLINDMKCDVNPQTQEKTPLYIATTLQPTIDKEAPTDLDHNQE